MYPANWWRHLTNAITAATGTLDDGHDAGVTRWSHRPLVNALAQLYLKKWW